ncbi:MAG TPA: hypothetical protein VE130_15900 [Nitrososphaeraceae archaeon]|nr:hypothetical protein [Nitrososphaeraceae archaeon]
MFVADYINSRIQVFDSTGTFITKWGSGDGEFDDPFGIAVDPSTRNVFVSDLALLRFGDGEHGKKPPPSN